MNRRPTTLAVVLALLCSVALPARADEPASTTEVLVVGTIHGRHATHPSYSYRHLARVFEDFDPDVICVEIRPEDFRRSYYLTEMVMATTWGLEHDRVVVPIDWWDSANNARDERARFEQADEYPALAREEERLRKASRIIRDHERQYGSYKKFSRRIHRYGPAFFNGEDYNDYVRESYRISEEVFGDSAVNLYYRSRNDRMLQRIEAAMAEHVGARVLVVTGAEHKHYFDDALGRRKDVTLAEFTAPAEEAHVSAAIVAVLRDGDARTYFDMHDHQVAAVYFQGRLTHLMHGPGMDFDPNRVPAANVRQAPGVIEDWMWDDPFTPRLQYELGWLAFHTGRYEAAIAHFERALADRDALEEADDEWRNALPVNVHRNIGLCHDAMGSREAALASYQTGLDLLHETRSGEWAQLVEEGYFGELRLLERPFRWRRGPVKDVRLPDLPGQERMRGRYWYVLEDIAYDAESGESPQVRLWAALPVDRREQRVRIGAIQPDPTAILTEPENGNRIVYWEIDAPAEGKALVFSYDFDVVVRSLLYDLDPEKALPVDPYSDQARLFTISEPWVEVTPAIEAMAREIVGDEVNPVLQARALFDWTVDEITYDYPGIADRGAEKSFERRKGDCGEFSRVFMAMARSLGIPARSVTANWLSSGGHAWAEVYLAPWGWVPVDTSVAQLVESGLNGQMGEEKIVDFLRTRGIPERERGWLFGNLYPRRLIVFVGDGVAFERADGETVAFQFMQPGGSAAHPPAIELQGLTAVSTGFYLFGDEATDEGVAQSKAAVALGPSWLAAGDFDKAILALQLKLEEDPQHSTTLFQLGQALFNTGRFEESQASFEASLAGTGGSTKPTTDTWSHIFVGMCRDVAGDREGAVAAYEAAIATGADYNGSLDTAQGFVEEAFSVEE